MFAMKGEPSQNRPRQAIVALIASAYSSTTTLRYAGDGGAAGALVTPRELAERIGIRRREGLPRLEVPRRRDDAIAAFRAKRQALAGQDPSLDQQVIGMARQRRILEGDHAVLRQH